MEVLIHYKNSFIGYASLKCLPNIDFPVATVKRIVHTIPIFGSEPKPLHVIQIFLE